MRSKIAMNLPRARAPNGAPRARMRRSAKASDPLYIQIMRALKQDIVTGVYPVGSQLPTEDELCRRFSVSRYTVREALRRLRDDDLILSRPRAGTIVVPRGAAGSYVHDVMSIKDLLAFATGARFAIESIKMVEIDAELALRTGLACGREWLTVTGFRQMEAAEFPICRTEYFINRDFAAVGRLLQRHSGPIFPLIEDLFGQTIVEVHQEIAAVMVSPALAAGLHVAAGSAALEMRRAYTTSTGEVAQVTINTHPASRFRHSMTMRRVKD
jgi:GntR family transcriptional regulator